jgi:hypothetical protein
MSSKHSGGKTLEKASHPSMIITIFSNEKKNPAKAALKFFPCNRIRGDVGEENSISAPIKGNPR